MRWPAARGIETVVKAEILTFGETMLRSKTPGHGRFFQSPTIEATFGGAAADAAAKIRGQ